MSALIREDSFVFSGIETSIREKEKEGREAADKNTAASLHFTIRITSFRGAAHVLQAGGQIETSLDLTDFRFPRGVLPQSGGERDPTVGDFDDVRIVRRRAAAEVNAFLEVVGLPVFDDGDLFKARLGCDVRHNRRLLLRDGGADGQGEKRGDERRSTLFCHGSWSLQRHLAYPSVDGCEGSV